MIHLMMTTKCTAPSLISLLLVDRGSPRQMKKYFGFNFLHWVSTSSVPPVPAVSGTCVLSPEHTVAGHSGTWNPYGRTASSLRPWRCNDFGLWTGQFSLSIFYPFHGALWLSGSVCNLQARDCRFDCWLGRVCCWFCALGQTLYPHVHPLNPAVKVGTLQDQEGLCVWLVMCAKTCGCQAVCSLGSWDGLWMNRVLWPGGNCVTSGELDIRL